MEYHEVILTAFFFIVVYAAVVERALALFFDIPWVDERLKWKNPAGTDGVVTWKGLIAALAGIILCYNIDLDLIAILVQAQDNALSAAETTAPKNTIYGVILTGMVVAGGSQGAVKLFQDVMGFSKVHRDAAKGLRQAEVAAKTAEAESRKAEAEAQRVRSIVGKNAAILKDAGRPALRTVAAFSFFEDNDVVRRALDQRIADPQRRSALSIARAQWRVANAARAASLTPDI